MSSYVDIVVVRAIDPEMATLAKQLRANIDATVGVARVVGTDSYRLKKASVWQSAEVTTATTLITNAAGVTEQLVAQATVDSFPVLWKAVVLTLVDQLNVIRAALPAPLPPITPAQALAAIRAKAGTL